MKTQKTETLEFDSVKIGKKRYSIGQIEVQDICYFDHVEFIVCSY